MGSLSTTTKPPIILYDYQFAPNAQKARNLLHALNLPYKSCTQPFFIPRSDLLDLGITYRRIPVSCIGRDVYCDNRVFYDAVLQVFAAESKKLLSANGSGGARARDEKAWEQFGYRTFWICLPLVPKELNDEKLQTDRMSLFAVFSNPDYPNLRPSALAELRAVLDVLENEVLVEGKRFIKGDELALEDLLAMWMIKWALQTMGADKENGFGKADWPRVYAWIDGVKRHDEEGDAPTIKMEEAKKVLLGSDYAVPKIGVDETDPTGLKEGTRVAVGCSDDAKPNHTLQYGKLVGMNRREVVVELENGLRVHFARVGSIVKAA